MRSILQARNPRRRRRRTALVNWVEARKGAAEAASALFFCQTLQKLRAEKFGQQLICAFMLELKSRRALKLNTFANFERPSKIDL
jgi:hypothetical protein